MLKVFKWPNGYALSSEKGLIQFTEYGLLGTEDEEIIERLENDPVVKFLGEGEEYMTYVPEKAEVPQTEVSDDEIRSLRKQYADKFGKKANGKRTLEELKEKLAETE